MKLFTIDTIPGQAFEALNTVRAPWYTARTSAGISWPA